MKRKCGAVNTALSTVLVLRSTGKTLLNCFTNCSGKLSQGQGKDLSPASFLWPYPHAWHSSLWPFGSPCLNADFIWYCLMAFIQVISTLTLIWLTLAETGVLGQEMWRGKGPLLGSHHPEVLNPWGDLEDLGERLQRGFAARAVPTNVEGMRGPAQVQLCCLQWAPVPTGWSTSHSFTRLWGVYDALVILSFLNQKILKVQLFSWGDWGRWREGLMKESLLFFLILFCRAVLGYRKIEQKVKDFPYAPSLLLSSPTPHR